MRQGRRHGVAVCAVTASLLACAAAEPVAADESGAAAAGVSAWATGGGSATAKPTDPDGKPGGSATGAAALPYWQAPAVPTAVIQGGAIPPGWQPQAVPYQGIGPNGRPVTMYVAPTYVFTYPVGPPVPAVPQVDRRRGRGIMRPGIQNDPYATGWNYRSTGATAVAPALPPPTVARYAPQPYRFPADSRALTGTPLVPPATVIPPMQPQTWGDAPAAAIAAQAVSPPPPPSGWAAANLPPTAGPPPAGWGPANPAAVPAAPAIVAGAAAAPAVAAATAPPLAALPPPIAPIPVATPAMPQPIPVTTASLPQSTSSTDTPSNVHAWKVVAVYDGDTVTCVDENNQQQRVRLAGIDAPESGQDFGKQARDALAGMVFGRTVQVVDDGRDSAGRWLGRLSVDGIDVNRRMVATGMAWSADSGEESYAAAEALARSGGIGLWSQPNPVPPATYRTQATQKT
jgi:endonuclease YncB( thermonuclease family)